MRRNACVSTIPLEPEPHIFNPYPQQGVAVMSLLAALFVIKDFVVVFTATPIWG
jgi:hypothetical protein